MKRERERERAIMPVWCDPGSWERWLAGAHTQPRRSARTHKTLHTLAVTQPHTHHHPIINGACCHAHTSSRGHFLPLAFQ